ncbi:hypothetical protein DPMN_150734 [Dreissena polymorpha]|uniref:Uncharacterized protein n=1 Tax=Dreissena polymorpha TaxID=45954 RepID=A0A9D4FG94_DREPO|nr:hypothetical protein DPMN_150734 [Dreissena polymorpha]
MSFEKNKQVLTRKNTPPNDGHVFQPTGTIFELVQDIIGTNLLTKFHKYRTINVASRVLKKFDYSHINIIGTNLLTKLHEDLKIKVASRVLTRNKSSPPDIIETNLLTKFHEDQTINVAFRVSTNIDAE